MTESMDGIRRYMVEIVFSSVVRISEVDAIPFPNRLRQGVFLFTNVLRSKGGKTLVTPLLLERGVQRPNPLLLCAPYPSV